MAQPHEQPIEVQIALLQQSVVNLTSEYGKFRDQIAKDMSDLRKQTHEWMQVLSNKLPNWAVVIGGFMCASLGAMAMWILTHH